MVDSSCERNDSTVREKISHVIPKAVRSTDWGTSWSSGSDTHYAMPRGHELHLVERAIMSTQPELIMFIHMREPAKLKFFLESDWVGNQVLEQVIDRPYYLGLRFVTR